MTLRPLQAGDVPALAAALAGLPLLRRYGRGAEEVAGDLRAALARGDGLIAAEADGRVAGLCWYLPAGTLAMGGYLKLLAVTAPGAGTGTRLLAAFEAEVARASRHAFLLVSDFNEGAQRFYGRHGYARVGGIPGLVLPDVAELIYWKRLR